MAVAGPAVAGEMGIEVPRQLSVVSWGDSALCLLTHPAITALAHDPMAYGAHAARRLLEVIDGAPPQAYLDSAHPLVPRGSTRPGLTPDAAAATLSVMDLRTAELLRRPLYGQCYDRGDADW
jgi:hypothetical protein